jgi:hypothetical protein
MAQGLQLYAPKEIDIILEPEEPVNQTLDVASIIPPDGHYDRLRTALRQWTQKVTKMTLYRVFDVTLIFPLEE